jgi:hypothetical protein
MRYMAKAELFTYNRALTWMLRRRRLRRAPRRV